MICVYKIQSTIKPERIYVGSTVTSFNHRRSLHLYNLRHNNHHSKKLQNHYNKYGESDLVFSVLTSCEKDNALSIEQFFIDSLNPWFNNSKKAGNCLGVKHTEEARRNMSRSHIGLIRSESHKINNGLARKGKHLSEKHRENLSKAHLGKKQSIEHVAKIVASNKGKKRYEEIKAKMRGKIVSEETRKKLSIALTGKKKSKEHIEKSRLAHLGNIPWNKGLHTGNQYTNKNKQHAA